MIITSNSINTGQICQIAYNTIHIQLSYKEIIIKDCKSYNKNTVLLIFIINNSITEIILLIKKLLIID